jgi:hypothetical protein
MHSHDRTLLAKLGFADPDRQNPEHDLACLYLRQPDVMSRVVGHLLDRGDGARRAYMKGRATPEYHLQKGYGQYATTVGFLDVCYAFTYSHEEGEARYHVTGGAFIEVKIAPTTVGDLLRQMNLYRAYLPHYAKWFGLVVAPWDITESVRDTLKSASLAYLKLGGAFRDWKASQRAARIAEI